MNFEDDGHDYEPVKQGDEPRARDVGQGAHQPTPVTTVSRRRMSWCTTPVPHRGVSRCRPYHY
ncbi:hypothetical protein I7I50_00783 [Histoplasma capsulatum G186AR]|uniref:Uncharacterized protein n=1 Tax=Ajellomyces capsulatus TaxID=5037 RepID=A0A8H8CV26_AJECA|nr:hypothetical protein I7I52_08051 [Histoplasma capsulatum]QSS72824.1 hypothetical protein I7I50_00783 [Histoplasma capsulatum G186AR]